mgnify:CR=1 FL=1
MNSVRSSRYAGIILASQSPRRQQLMEQMGVAFRVQASNMPEMPSMGERPNAFAVRMALEKAVKVGENQPDFLVIGADTVVAIGDQILGKPKSRQEAAMMLSQLSKQWHEVWTGICVYCRAQNIQINRAACTEVCFRELPMDEIEAYVATGEPDDKAGSYAIQGEAKKFVREIRGSYHNVIGLPTIELGKILYELGVLEAPSNYGC